MKSVLEFLGALAFLGGMLLAGLAVAVGLWQLALAAGANDDLMQILYFPIGLVAIFACGLTGKGLHRLISRLY